VNDIDWERAACAVGLSVLTAIGAYVLCRFLGVNDFVRDALAFGSCLAIARMFYSGRSNKTRGGVPVE
jgi:hypothetical protein